MNLPDEFVKRMRDQLAGEADEFFHALSNPSPTSIRLNHVKGKTAFSHLQPVPWCDTGFYIEKRPFFHLDPHWHGGAYYVQEASSMVLDHVISTLNLDNSPRIWLDACAAPGGKTGILAKHMKDPDVLLANEVVSQRRSVLRENLYKAGFMNTFISGEPSSSFKEPFADIILIDAPCAGEGMMRKEPEAIKQWSPALVRECSMMQQRIVNDSVSALQPGGYLIYSTCSYSHAENIENVKLFSSTHSLTSISIFFPDDWGITTIHESDVTGYQLYPHRVRGEGLFISVLQKEMEDNKIRSRKKPGSYFSPIPDWLKRNIKEHDQLFIQRSSPANVIIKKEAEEKANQILSRFPGASLISETGQLKGKDLIPSHFAAMSGLFQEFPVLEVTLDQCLDYLGREIRTLPPVEKDGWYLISFDGTVIGWAKKTNQGWKNHYPLQWRLRSRKM